MPYKPYHITSHHTASSIESQTRKYGGRGETHHGADGDLRPNLCSADRILQGFKPVVKILNPVKRGLQPLVTRIKIPDPHLYFGCKARP